VSGGASADAGLVSVRIALLSVADKRGLLELARALDRLEVTLGCTDGTYATLYTQGLEAELLSRYVRPLLDGRVTTLYPELHGPIAARADELEALAAVGLEPIDLVVCNPRRFERAARRPDVTRAIAAEAIDGGGIALIRAAAKNCARVAVVVDPDDYPAIVDELERTGGALGAATRLRLAAKAFAVTAAHDAAVAGFLAEVPGDAGDDDVLERPRLPALVSGPWRRADVTLDDAPHDAADDVTDDATDDATHDATHAAADDGALYADPPASVAIGLPVPTVVDAQRVAGAGGPLPARVVGELDRALALVRELDAALTARPDGAHAAAVIACADQPVAASVAAHPAGAVEHVLGFAREAEATLDRPEPARGALAVDVAITAPLARLLAGSGLAAIIAPAITDDARAAWPADGPRVLIAGGRWHDDPVGSPWLPALAWRSLAGGLLVQELDVAPIGLGSLQVVTARAPSDDELRDLALAARVARHVRAHALVIARHAGTLAISGGEPDLRRALPVAHVTDEELLHGAVAALSVRLDDALDVDALAAAGIRAVHQPGGSPADIDVIKAADRHGIAMLMSGIEHLRRGERTEGSERIRTSRRP
jgi:phosphoribosylaminoimidazolecarboxamide formyltransferase/IMP cyclohydrolase